VTALKRQVFDFLGYQWRPSWPPLSTSSWSSWGSLGPSSTGLAMSWCTLCGQPSRSPGTSSLFASSWRWGGCRKWVSRGLVAGPLSAIHGCLWVTVSPVAGSWPWPWLPRQPWPTGGTQQRLGEDLWFDG
ncbi:unnamed protein product, partial [Gulo gulo]